MGQRRRESLSGMLPHVLFGATLAEAAVRARGQVYDPTCTRRLVLLIDGATVREDEDLPAFADTCGEGLQLGRRPVFLTESDGEGAGRHL